MRDFIRTEGGGVEGGHLVGDALAAGDDCLALAVPDEHQVGLLPPDLQDIFFVPGCSMMKIKSPV